MEPPPRSIAIRNPKNQFWFVSIWISTAGVILPPLVGMLGTVFSMVLAFDEVGRSGESDPESLAQNISLALFTTAIGVGLSVLSFLFLILAIVRFFQTRNTPG